MIGSLSDSRKMRRVSAALWIDTVGESCNFVSKYFSFEDSCYLGQASVQPISQLQDLTSQTRLRRIVIKIVSWMRSEITPMFVTKILPGMNLPFFVQISNTDKKDFPKKSSIWECRASPNIGGICHCFFFRPEERDFPWRGQVRS